MSKHQGQSLSNHLSQEEEERKEKSVNGGLNVALIIECRLEQTLEPILEQSLEPRRRRTKGKRRKRERKQKERKNATTKNNRYSRDVFGPCGTNVVIDDNRSFRLCMITSMFVTRISYSFDRTHFVFVCQVSEATMRDCLKCQKHSWVKFCSKTFCQARFKLGRD